MEKIITLNDEKRWLVVYGLDALIADCLTQLGGKTLSCANARFLRSQMTEAKELKLELT